MADYSKRFSFDLRFSKQLPWRLISEWDYVNQQDYKFVSEERTASIFSVKEWDKFTSCLKMAKIESNVRITNDAYGRVPYHNMITVLPASQSIRKALYRLVVGCAVFETPPEHRPSILEFLVIFHSASRQNQKYCFTMSIFVYAARAQLDF
jgi:hypothetical protein